MNKSRLLELAGLSINEAKVDFIQQIAMDHIKMAKDFLEDEKAEGYDNNDVLQLALDNFEATVSDVKDTMKTILSKK